MAKAAYVWTWAGTVEYGEALRWQEKLVERRATGTIADMLLALEHPPVFTLGTRASPAHMPSPDTAARFGAAVYRCNRGGSVTYHGPGQLVGYCITHLEVTAYDIHAYLRLLEQALIEALSCWGVAARRDAAHTGVWVGPAKIASIGVRVSRRIAWHGFALNLATDLAPFSAIAPCGIAGCPVTSLAALGVNPPEPAVAAAAVAGRLAGLLGYGCCRQVPALEDEDHESAPSCSDEYARHGRLGASERFSGRDRRPA
jgi:lipoyl(octanoyl) transferase